MIRSFFDESCILLAHSLFFSFPHWIVKTNWNVSRPTRSIMWHDRRHAAHKVHFHGNTMTLTDGFRTDSSAYDTYGTLDYFALTEITMSREGCADECGPKQRGLNLFLGKVYSKSDECKPRVQCLKVAEAIDGNAHLAVYGLSYIVVLI